MELYAASLPDHVLNSEEDILHLIARYKKMYGDEFFSVAFVDAGEVIGYAEFIWFKAEKSIFFDYLCVPPKMYGLNHSLPLMRRLLNFVYDQTEDGIRIIFEVAHKTVGINDFAPDMARVRFFEYLGFRRIVAPFRYPDLGRREKSYPADIMISDREFDSHIPLSAMLDIGKTIYFSNYLRWDKAFLAEDKWARREAFLTALYIDFISSASSSGSAHLEFRAQTYMSALRTTIEFSLYQALCPVIANPRIWLFFTVTLFLCLTNRYFQLGASDTVTIALGALCVSIWLFDPKSGEKIITKIFKRRIPLWQLV